jgi:hypothetical protein
MHLTDTSGQRRRLTMRRAPAPLRSAGDSDDVCAPALGGGGCGSESHDALLADLRSPILELSVSDADMVEVLIAYAGTLVGDRAVCPTIRTGLQATLNGRAMKLVDWNTGSSVGPCPAGVCVECQVNLSVTGGRRSPPRKGTSTSSSRMRARLSPCRPRASSFRA